MDDKKWVWSSTCNPVTLNQGQGQYNKYQNIEYNIYHNTKFESHWFINIWMHAKFFEAVSKTAVISLVSINLTQK